jgi:hypothetical protein
MPVGDVGTLALWALGVFVGAILLAVVVNLLMHPSRVEGRRRTAEERERTRELAWASICAEKLPQLRRFLQEVETRSSLLDADYRERYAHEHYDEVMAQRHARRKEISAQLVRWEEDPHVQGLQREIGDRRGLATERAFAILREEVALYQLAEGLTRAEREAWENKQIRRLQTATDQGMTVRELNAAEETERQLRTVWGEGETALREARDREYVDGLIGGLFAEAWKGGKLALQEHAGHEPIVLTKLGNLGLALYAASIVRAAERVAQGPPERYGVSAWNEAAQARERVEAELFPRVLSRVSDEQATRLRAAASEVEATVLKDARGYTERFFEHAADRAKRVAPANQEGEAVRDRYLSLLQTMRNEYLEGLGRARTTEEFLRTGSRA